MDSNFGKLLASPGLSWIADDIFCLLDHQSLLNCELTCQSWRSYFFQSQLWRKYLLRIVARKGSFERCLLEDQFQNGDGEPVWKIAKGPNFYRTLCYKLSRKGLKSNWFNGRYYRIFNIVIAFLANFRHFG